MHIYNCTSSKYLLHSYLTHVKFIVIYFLIHHIILKTFSNMIGRVPPQKKNIQQIQPFYKASQDGVVGPIEGWFHLQELWQRRGVSGDEGTIRAFFSVVGVVLPS